MLFRRKKKHNEQKTFCYCDCGNELVSNHKEMYEGDDTLVHYICVCGKKSSWDFSAPAPILISEES